MKQSKKIAESTDKTPAQVLIKWSLQCGFIVMPKSVNKDRIAENIDVFGFELTKSEMEEINKLNKNERVTPGWIKGQYL